MKPYFTLFILTLYCLKTPFTWAQTPELKSLETLYVEIITAYDQKNTSALTGLAQELLTINFSRLTKCPEEGEQEDFLNPVWLYETILAWEMPNQSWKTRAAETNKKKAEEHLMKQFMDCHKDRGGTRAPGAINFKADHFNIPAMSYKEKVIDYEVNKLAQLAFVSQPQNTGQLLIFIYNKDTSEVIATCKLLPGQTCSKSWMPKCDKTACPVKVKFANESPKPKRIFAKANE